MTTSRYYYESTRYRIDTMANGYWRVDTVVYRFRSWSQPATREAEVDQRVQKPKSTNESGSRSRPTSGEAEVDRPTSEEAEVDRPT